LLLAASTRLRTRTVGVGIGTARGVELVLRVQQVQQAALADVELLAIGVARLLDGQHVAVSACTGEFGRR
jgi:hypothetical protein